MKRYIAQSRLNLGGGKFIEIGQPVPGFDKWPENVKRAHLRLKMVAESKLTVRLQKRA
jgi:hypothetical protein